MATDPDLELVANASVRVDIAKRELRAAEIAAHYAGHSLRTIAAAANCSHQTVYTVLKEDLQT